MFWLKEYWSLSWKYVYLASTKIWTIFFSRIFCVYFFNHLFLHNLFVVNSDLPDDILYLVTFTYKLAKHKMTAKM